MQFALSTCFLLSVVCTLVTSAPEMLVARATDPSSSPLLPLNKNFSQVTITDDLYGTREVSYFLTSTGKAIIDGDVLYGTEEELLSHGVGNGNIARSFSVVDMKWPNGVVTYKYASNDAETKVKAPVDAAIARWKAKAPYLTFTRLPANNNDAVNGVLTISATDCDGCHAHVGYQNTHRRMNLQQGCSSGGGTCGINEATHEFGHALGLLHEHQRPDRDSFVTYNCANVDPKCNTMPFGATCCDTNVPSGCCESRSNFNVVNNGDSSGSYDAESIMQYRNNAFAKAGLLTLTPARADIVIPNSNPSTPSETDFTRICKIYAAECDKAKACKNLGCPVLCPSIGTCAASHACLGPEPPFCCFPTEVSSCRTRRTKCQRLGCGFLTPL